MIRRVLSNRTYYNIIRRLISTDERLKYNILGSFKRERSE